MDEPLEGTQTLAYRWTPDEVMYLSTQSPGARALAEPHPALLLTAPTRDQEREMIEKGSSNFILANQSKQFTFCGRWDDPKDTVRYFSGSFE